MSKRFALVVFALAGEVSTTALPLEYVQALESDDTCLPGGSSCSLALSQLRASARGRQSSLTEKPFPKHAFEKLDADIALHADGVPSPKIAALMARESLEADLPANQLVPAVSHSELPWAAEAANDAEQKAAEDEPQGAAMPKVHAPVQAQPQGQMLSESPAQVQTQAQDPSQAQPVIQPQTQQVQPGAQPQPQATPQAPQPQAQPQAQVQAQLQSTADSQPAHQELAAQVLPWDMQPKSPPEVPQEEPQAAPEEATKAVPQDGLHAAPEEATEAAPQEEVHAEPEEATEAVPQEQLHAAPEEATKAAPEEEVHVEPKEEDDRDDQDMAGDEERRSLGVDSYTMKDLVAMAGEKGAKVLWNAAAPSEEASKTRTARFHHSRADEPNMRSHSKTPHSLSKAHSEPQHSSSSDHHFSHGGPYSKAKGGYKDVVLSRSTSAKHHVHAPAPVSLSSQEGQNTEHGTANASRYTSESQDAVSTHSTRSRSESDSKADDAADSEGFARRLRRFHSHPLWIENCTQIFLDIGSGQGGNIKALYEPESLNGSMKFLLTLQQVFKLPKDRRLPANESGLCALGMEPDRRYHSQLHELKKGYKSRGWNVHFYPFAAWSAGAGLLSMSGGKVSNASHHGGASHPKEATEVMSVGLPDFVRSLPPKVGVSLLTLDIEGSESEVLTSLLAEKILCQSVVRSALIAGSPEDMVKRERAQRCSGKATPVVDLRKYLA